jgi:hypothetical protein
MIWILHFGYEKKNVRNIGCPHGGESQSSTGVEVEVTQGVMLR